MMERRSTVSAELDSLEFAVKKVGNNAFTGLPVVTGIASCFCLFNYCILLNFFLSFSFPQSSITALCELPIATQHFLLIYVVIMGPAPIDPRDSCVFVIRDILEFSVKQVTSFTLN